VAITPGQGKFPASFKMGTADGPLNERPVHEVTFKAEFAIARYEVPQNLYEAVMGNNPSRWSGKRTATNWTGARNAAEMFTWKEAVQFCEKATSLLRQAKLIGDDEVIRLPTEAEWEYCCRAGTTTPYSFGESATAAGDTGKQASILNDFGW